MTPEVELLQNMLAKLRRTLRYSVTLQTLSPEKYTDLMHETEQLYNHVDALMTEAESEESGNETIADW